MWPEKRSLFCVKSGEVPFLGVFSVRVSLKEGWVCGFGFECGVRLCLLHYSVVVRSRGSTLLE